MKNKKILFKSLEIALDSPNNFNWGQWGDQTFLVTEDDPEPLNSQGKLRREHIENALIKNKHEICNTTLCLGGNYCLILPDKFQVRHMSLTDMETGKQSLPCLREFHENDLIDPIFKADTDDIENYSGILGPLFPTAFDDGYLYYCAEELEADLVVYWVLVYGMDKKLFSFEDLTPTLKEFYTNITNR